MAATNAAAQELLKNPQFLKLFERALKGDSDDSASLGAMPPDGSSERDAWLKKLQDRLQKETTNEMKAEVEKVQHDEHGQWMMVLPEPGFCIKTTLAGGTKVFINVCQHPRIAEPVPMDDEAAAADEVRYRIPISCGQARPDQDKSGKPCKVYDVIVNPSTIHRCRSDTEFRRFVAALCMQWIKQKSEPTLNSDEFRNINIKCKGKLELQRIRLTSQPKVSNVMGDEIQLPLAPNAATAPSQVGGSRGDGKLIQEIVDKPNGATPSPSSSLAKTDLDVPSSTPASPQASIPSTAAVKSIVAEGRYDWSTHAKPTANPFFRENVPENYVVELLIPGIQTIREVDVRVSTKRIDCFYIDEVEDDNKAEEGTGNGGASAAMPFLSATFGYPVLEDVLDAKYIRKKSLLRLRVAVKLPDETKGPATRPERDVVEVEEEEARKDAQRREAEWEAHQKKSQRLQKEEENVQAERRSCVENLSAIQSGAIPPVIRSEIDEMPRDQLVPMLQRLESRTQKGDSLDELMVKLPESAVDSICVYLREKLSLQPRAAPPAPASPPVDPSKEEAKRSTEREKDVVKEFNYAKRSEALFGVALHNRYVFALD